MFIVNGVSGSSLHCINFGAATDPFCGAGTTVLASVLEGYEAVGIEVTDAYYKLGVDRVRFALEAQEKSEDTAGQ